MTGDPLKAAHDELAALTAERARLDAARTVVGQHGDTLAREHRDRADHAADAITDLRGSALEDEYLDTLDRARRAEALGRDGEA